VGLGLEQQLRGVERPLGDARVLRFPAGTDQWQGALACIRAALIPVVLRVMRIEINQAQARHQKASSKFGLHPIA
jgi:hypothetical protein